MDDADERGGEADLDEESRNPTQRRMDERGVEDVPVDVPWTDEAEAGEVEVEFEPDVPLVGEVNREAGEAEDRRRRLSLVGGLAAALGAAAAGLVALVRRRR
jgi:hypothetical protein